MKKEIEIPVIVAGRLNSANLIEEIIEKMMLIWLLLAEVLSQMKSL
jgi:hypothetical protein